MNGESKLMYVNKITQRAEKKWIRKQDPLADKIQYFGIYQHLLKDY